MHDPRPDKAAEFRQHANEIRTMARQISLNEPRNKLLDAAGRLDVLAKEEERMAGQAATRSERKSEA